MKRVFTNSSDVIHIFAQQSQNEARCTNVFFESTYNSKLNYGTKLYSYGRHYLLAEFLDENTIIINDKGYSVTTSKHISQVTRATRQYKQYFETNCNIDLVYSDIMSNKDKLGKAKKPELYIKPILYRWQKLNEYISDRKKINIKKSNKYKELKRIVKAIQDKPEEYKEKLYKIAIKQAKEQKRKDEQLKKEALRKFFAYEINDIYINDISCDYVRISQNKESIETSQRVSVPIKEAKILYLRIKQGKDIKGFNIGGYTVISINGTLKIGCHNIDKTNLIEIGEKILNL